MWVLDHKEGWPQKIRCFWIVVLEEILESPLDCKEIKSVNPKGNQPWILIWRTDAETEAPILWPDVKMLCHWKRLWCWERLRAGGEQYEMVAWHYQLMDMSLRRLQNMVKEREARCAAIHGVPKSQLWLSDWKTAWNYNCDVSQHH